MISWWEAFLLALMCGVTAWAGTRVGNWQDTRAAKRKFEGSMAILQRVIDDARKAAEEVTRARQSGSDD